ncbi:MFS transporter [Streptomyces rugosispiralis]|uniref:MFS transporter n=1 Tax=Streptomyces rugosispiralis TaxID=2967341 RepID=A0ABT1V5W0_9ACTN|nr:MFS transporter [Streptomyces rugosispiralis]MCQ8192682.1 MFS transporter [Streptomyces rugosispiralis]
MLTLVYMSLTSWSVAVNELADNFGLSTVTVQLGSSALIAGYAIGGFVQGRLLARFGWRRVFTWVILAFLLASALIPVADNYALILILRFVQGWGCMVTVTSAIVSSWFPMRERGLALGVLLGTIGLGSAFGGYVAGLLNPVIGWQNTFWTITAVTVVGAIGFYVLVRQAPPLAEESVQETNADSPSSLQADPHSTESSSVYRQPALWILGVITLCCFFNVYGMYAYLAQYLFTLHYSSAAVGLAVFLNGFVAVVSTPVGGWISDRLVVRMGALRGRTFTNAWPALAVAAVGCTLLPHLAPLGLGFTIGVVIVAGWGGPATNGPGLSLPSDLFGSAAAGPGVGLVLLIAGAGGIIAPIFVPLLAQATSWTVGWYVTAGAAVIGLLLNLVLGRQRARTASPAVTSAVS